MDKLSAGERLTAGQSLTSPNGKYDLTMQTDGNLVLYDSGRPVWASETSGSGAERVEMRPDGNLVIYGRKDKPVWSSQTNGNSGAHLTLQDDRNLVIYPTAGPPLWASATFDKVPPAAARNSAKKSASAPKNSSKTYTIERGDSLWAIAERFYGDGDEYMRIAKANNIANPDRINPGQKIIIPD